jgi:hypothetical protein
MDLDLILGIGVIVGSSLLMVVLYAWSVRRIEIIHRKRLVGLRAIEREFRNRRGSDG